MDLKPFQCGTTGILYQNKTILSTGFPIVFIVFIRF